MEILWSHLQPSHSGHLYDLRVFFHISSFRWPSQDHISNDVLYFWLRTFIHLHITITLAWPIMEDIEPFDLGLGDRPREFETVTHFTFCLEQYHIHIPTLWTCRPTHFEPDMTPPLGTITRLYYPCSPYHATVPLPFLSIISLIWLGRVRDG